jgi:hypothetical protein
MTNFEKPSSPDNNGQPSPEEIADIERRVAFCTEVDRLVENVPVNPETDKSEIWFAVFGMELLISSQVEETGAVRQVELHYPSGITTSNSGEVRRMSHVVVYTSDTTVAEHANLLRVSTVSDIYKPGSDDTWVFLANHEHATRAYTEADQLTLTRLLKPLDPEQGMYLDLE